MEELIGKKITNILLSPENLDVTFLTDENPLHYLCRATCCSETSIYEIKGVAALLGGVVTAVKEMDLCSCDHCQGELKTLYGYKITTNKGYGIVAFRNEKRPCCSSDCEGSLDFVGHHVDRNWNQVTEDFES